jgi:hypothetical protein
MDSLIVMSFVAVRIRTFLMKGVLYREVTLLGSTITNRDRRKYCLWVDDIYTNGVNSDGLSLSPQ